MCKRGPGQFAVWIDTQIPFESLVDTRSTLGQTGWHEKGPVTGHSSRTFLRYVPHVHTFINRHIRIPYTKKRTKITVKAQYGRFVFVFFSYALLRIRKKFVYTSNDTRKFNILYCLWWEGNGIDKGKPGIIKKL